MYVRMLIGVWVAMFCGASLAAPKPIRVVKWQENRQELGLVQYDPYANHSGSAVVIVAKGFESLSAELKPYVDFLPGKFAMLTGERFGSGDDGTAMAAYFSSLLGYSEKGPELLLAAVDTEADLVEALKSVGGKSVTVVISSVTFPEKSTTSPELKSAILDFLKDKNCPWIQASGEKRGITAMRKPVFTSADKYLSWKRESVGLELVSYLAFLPLKITLSAFTTAPEKQSPSDAQVMFCVYRGKKGVPIDKHTQEACSEWSAGKSSLKLTLDSNDGDSFYLYAQTKADKATVEKMRLVFEAEPLTDRKIVGADGVARNLAFPTEIGGMDIRSPGDLDELIVAGSSDSTSGVGPSSSGEPKPNVLVDSARVAFNDGREFVGSGIAAVEVGAAIAQMRAFEPRFLTRDDVVAFRTFWPRKNMAKAGWTFNQATLESLVKKHPGVTKYLAGKVGSNWVGVVKDGQGNFTVGTTVPTNTLGTFNEKAGERNLYFLSAPAYDITGNSVTTHVIPESKDGRSIYVPSDSFKPELSVQVVRLAHPSKRFIVDKQGAIVESDQVPLFFSMPSPNELAEYVAYRRLNEMRVPARYAEQTYSFPEKLFELIPKPVVQKPKVEPAPVYTPPVYTEPVARYRTTNFYLLNRQNYSLKVYVKFQTGAGTWTEKTVTLKAREERYMGQIAEGSRYYTDADGFTAGWDDVGTNISMTRMKF